LESLSSMCQQAKAIISLSTHLCIRVTAYLRQLVLFRICISTTCIKGSKGGCVQAHKASKEHIDYRMEGGLLLPSIASLATAECIAETRELK